MAFFDDLLKGVMGATAVGAGINALTSSPTTRVTTNPPLAPSSLETSQMQLNIAQQIANLREAGYDVQFQPGGSISLAERPLRPEEQLTRATRGTAQGSVLAQLMRDEANPAALRDQLGSALTARRTASMTGRKGINRVGLIRSILSRQGGGMPGLGQQGGTTIPGGGMGGLGGTTIPPLSSQPQGGGKATTSGGGSSGLGTALSIASPLLGGGAAIAKQFGLFGPGTPSAPAGTDPATGLPSSEFSLPKPSQPGTTPPTPPTTNIPGLGGGDLLAPGAAAAFPGGVPSVFSPEFGAFAGPGADLGLDIPLGIGAGAGAEAGTESFLSNLFASFNPATIPFSVIAGGALAQIMGLFSNARAEMEKAKEKGFSSQYFEQIKRDPQAWANQLGEAWGPQGKLIADAALQGKINNWNDILNVLGFPELKGKLEELQDVEQLPNLSQWATRFIAAPGEQWHGPILIESNRDNIGRVLEQLKNPEAMLEAARSGKLMRDMKQRAIDEQEPDE